MTLRIKEILNMGICPNCSEHTHFNRTYRRHIFTCSICQHAAEQKINGKVLYKEVTLPGVIVDH